jgi:hypothetical protein
LCLGTYTCGRYTNGSTLSGMRGATSAFDLTGTPIWSTMNLRPLSSTTRMYASDFLIDNNDSILVVYYGDLTGTNAVTNNLFLSKSDLNGNISWAKSYQIGGMNNLVPYAVEEIGNDYLIYGTNRQISGALFLIRVNSVGDILWAYQYGNMNNINAISSNSILVDNNSIVLAGALANGANDDVLFVKLDSSGMIDNSCVNITALNVTATPILNPVNTPVNLIVYNNPLSFNNSTSTLINTNLTYTAICETNCSYEICDNGIDDDGDGLADCLDPDCPCYVCVDSSSRYWYFGNLAGIDFGSGSPVAVTNSAMSTSEGVATTSDKAGNLLFYTNGLNVWDASHNIMLNGTGLGGSSISAQSSIILPMPNNDSIYYILTVPNWTDPAANRNLSYSIVNKNRNGGLGEVTLKNVILHTDVAEQVSATYHENCEDIWIVSHERLNNNFVSYLLTSTGISITPIISVNGAISSGANRYGGLRFSHNSQQLCSTLGGSSTTPTVQLFDFDNSSGIISNALPLVTNTAYFNAYSSEFSADNKVLYVCEFNGNSILQYDLTLPAPLIAGSATNIALTTATKSALQIGPDGKIYVAKQNNGFLGVIDNPSGLGLSCNYIDNAVSLSGRTATIGLPNFLPDLFEKNLYIDGIANVCPNETNVLFLASKKICQTYGYQWSVTISERYTYC